MIKLMVIVFCLNLPLISFAGSLKLIDTYQVIYNSESKSKLELNRIKSISDIGDYKYGYAVFSKLMLPIQQNDSSVFTYEQYNAAYSDNMVVELQPSIRDKKITVNLKYGMSILKWLNDNKIAWDDYFRAIGHAIFLTYEKHSQGKFDSILLKVDGISKDKIRYEVRRNTLDQKLIENWR